jgi:transposase InsO family protein
MRHLPVPRMLSPRTDLLGDGLHRRGRRQCFTDPDASWVAADVAILDDFSRYVIAWELCTTMRAADVTDNLQLALEASGCGSVRVRHKPRLLSDNGSSYISGDLAEWLEKADMKHVRGAPNHPQTQGKIERWHQTLKNRILLENYYPPGDLEAQIGRFIEHYNLMRYHESLKNLKPADVYFGRGQTILNNRERIKRDTIQNRRLQHRVDTGHDEREPFEYCFISFQFAHSGIGVA